MNGIKTYNIRILFYTKIGSPMKIHFLAVLTAPLFLITSNLYACDDKPCETAYIASTQQYISNTERHAEAVRSERLEYLSNFERQFEAALKERRAHARNRERRDYALYNHFHRTTPAKTERVSFTMTPKKMINKNKPTMI